MKILRALPPRSNASFQLYVCVDVLNRIGVGAEIVQI